MFPERKFLSKEVLILIKTLRSEGCDVILLPEEVEYQYLFKKGETSFLSDPANLLLVGIPVTIATTLITNWIQKLIDKSQNKKPEGNNVIVYNFITNQATNYLNQPADINTIADSKNTNKALANTLAECLKTKSPYPELPFPILLEHQPIIVGWCSLKVDDNGLLIDEGRITDVDTYKRIKKGELKGGSVTGIAEESRCSICQNNYIACNHIAGHIYDEKECINRIIKSKLIEVSIVSDPINPNTIIKLL